MKAHCLTLMGSLGVQVIWSKNYEIRYYEVLQLQLFFLFAQSQSGFWKWKKRIDIEYFWKLLQKGFFAKKWVFYSNFDFI